MNDLEKILESMQGVECRVKSLHDFVDEDEDVCRLIPGLPFFLHDVLTILKANNDSLDNILTNLPAQKKWKV